MELLLLFCANSLKLPEFMSVVNVAKSGAVCDLTEVCVWYAFDPSCVTNISCVSYLEFVASVICTRNFPPLNDAIANEAMAVAVLLLIVALPSDAAELVKDAPDIVTKLKFPDPSVFITCPAEPSADGYFNPLIVIFPEPFALNSRLEFDVVVFISLSVIDICPSTVKLFTSTAPVPLGVSTIF